MNVIWRRVDGVYGEAAGKEGSRHEISTSKLAVDKRIHPSLSEQDTWPI